MRQKAPLTQGGGSPPPTKPSQQSVLNLGAKAVRRGLSVGKGAYEPQCESVKPISLVKSNKRKPIPYDR